eukprot:4597762-Ditylum_brightwellii.AAC.1
MARMDHIKGLAIMMIQEQVSQPGVLRLGVSIGLTPSPTTTCGMITSKWKESLMIDIWATLGTATETAVKACTAQPSVTTWRGSMSLKHTSLTQMSPQ